MPLKHGVLQSARARYFACFTQGEIMGNSYYGIRHSGARKTVYENKRPSLPHALPLMFDNIQIFYIDIIKRVFTGITANPGLNQAGIHIVINRRDSRILIQLLLSLVVQL